MTHAKRGGFDRRRASGRVRQNAIRLNLKTTSDRPSTDDRSTPESALVRITAEHCRHYLRHLVYFAVRSISMSRRPAPVGRPRTRRDGLRAGRRPKPDAQMRRVLLGKLAERFLEYRRQCRDKSGQEGRAGRGRIRHRQRGTRELRTLCSAAHGRRVSPSVSSRRSNGII